MHAAIRVRFTEAGTCHDLCRWGPKLESHTYKDRYRIYLSEQVGVGCDRVGVHWAKAAKSHAAAAAETAI